VTTGAGRNKGITYMIAYLQNCLITYLITDLLKIAGVGSTVYGTS
jgi:hypothetical protein